jgi:poly(3-hydroxybutyrate) depolymerase
MCDGIAYDVEIPTACAAGGCGVVFDIHGYSMTADQEDKSTGLRALGRENGYVIVQPTAPSAFIVPSWTPTQDDPKIWSFLSDTRTALSIDPKKIHFTGFSQGGAISWYFVCQHADVLASAAPVAAGDDEAGAPAISCPFNATQSPSQQIPVLQMHGIQDGLVPFTTGTGQRDAALMGWGLANPTVVSSDASYSHTRYTNASGLVFEFIQHNYIVDPPPIPLTIKGHCLPGGQDLKANATSLEWAYLSCAPPNGFVWGQVMMDFFIAHPRQ